MALKRVGPSLYSDGGTVFRPQAATVFPDREILVTEGTTHLQNREVYCELLEKELDRSLTPSERIEVFLSGVDLIVQPDVVLIRPDPDQMDRVMAADEQLQERVNKRRIRFLLAANDNIRTALTQRGELWRIAPEAKTNEQMWHDIQQARGRIEGRAIYYHSPASGTRYLTLKEFRELPQYGIEELSQLLLEVQEYLQKKNQQGNWEVDFYLGSPAYRQEFIATDFSVDDETLLALHKHLASNFEQSVPVYARTDAPRQKEWLEQFYSVIYPPNEDVADPDSCLGLAAEFRKHIQWLPGARLKKGHIDYDSVFDEQQQGASRSTCPDKRYHRAKGIILNFVRDYELDHINVGWLNESLSRAHRPPRGHRDVYVVEMRVKREDHDQLRILRMQKWDMTYRLNCGKDLATAMVETEQYMEYTQDRYLGCRRLGMNLFGPVRVGRISELYQGVQKHLRGLPIWTPYFERPYVDGIASDKVPEDRWERPGYAEALAGLLGEAAAPNIIVGRGDGDFRDKPDEELIVFFDDGDEIIVEDNGLPDKLIVTHHTGSFWHFSEPLYRYAYAYAQPVLRRWGDLRNPEEFGEIYLDSMIRRFREIQREFREETHSFCKLFQLRHVDPQGNFAHRWQCVLERLNETEAGQLKDAIARHIADGPRKKNDRDSATCREPVVCVS